MSWPLSHEFNEAVQNPSSAFADPDLKGGETIVAATGLPLPRSGNFADVYQLRGTDGREWAVKCFTRPVTGLAERYARVSEALENARLPFTVRFTFLTEGIRVAGVWRPVVKMEWVDGPLLNQVVRDNAAKPAVLTALGQLWVKLGRRLRESGIAHADVQHGNVLLVPGTRAGAYGLKLIDYDGMWVPALANTPSGEVGHSAYQHPARAAAQAYSPDVDRFPQLVVVAALWGLSVGGSALWAKYDNGDNLLFTEHDFKKPSASKLMRELWQTGNPAVQSLVGQLALACGKPIPQTPWLDEIAPEGEPTPLDNAARREAAAALGCGVPVAVASRPAKSSAPSPVRRPKPTFAVWGWAVVVGVVLVTVIAGAAVFLPKPEQTAQTREPIKPKEQPKPPITKTPPSVPPEPKEVELAPPPRLAPPEPVVLVARWSVAANSDGAPATLQIRDQSILLGSRRTSLAAFDLTTGAKQPEFSLMELTGGDTFSALDRGRVAKYAPDDTAVRTWDVLTGKVGDKFPVPTIPPGVGDATEKLVWLSPDTRYLVVARGASAPGVHDEVPFRVFATDKTGKTIVNTTWWAGPFTSGATRGVCWSRRRTDGFAGSISPSGNRNGVGPRRMGGRTR